MNQVNPILADAKNLGYTGTVPNGATGVKKGGNGEIIFTFGDGKPAQSYNVDGSPFKQLEQDANTPKVDNTPAADNGAGRTPASDDGKGNNNKVQNSVWGNGFGGMNGMGMGNGFGFGMQQGFMDAGWEVDPKKFNQAAFGLSTIINLGAFMPSGLGSLFTSGGIMAAMQNFMKAVSFNFKFGNEEVSTYDEKPDENPGDNPDATSVGGGQSTPEGASGRTPGTQQKPEEAPEGGSGAGAGAGTGAGTGAGSEGRVDAADGGSVAPAKKKKQPAKTNKKDNTTPAHAPKQKTEAELAKEGGYVKLTNGKYRKNGQIYEFKNGQFTYFADNTFNDGRFVKDGKVYNSNGTPSKTTPATPGYKAMNTLAYFQNDGNDYKISHYNGRTVLETKSGHPKITRYFDSAGRLVQTNSFDRGGVFRDPVNTVSRYTYSKNGVMTKEETSNVLNNKTVTIEYNVRGAKPGKTTTRGHVQTEQRMDGQGRVSTFKYQATTTVEFAMYNGRMRKITTVVQNPVR